jgi:uncharacterized SAM-binding protein YcdF (DUF218 family)
VEQPRARGRIVRDALTGAIIAVLTAVAGSALGIQDLIRFPDLGLYLPAGILGALIGPTRLRPLIWIAALPVVATVLVVVYTPIVSVLAQPLVRRDTLPPSLDAIATLSKGVTPAGQMRTETLERLLAGISLAGKTKTRALLASRERQHYAGRAVSDSADLQQVLDAFDPAVEVIFVDSVFTTRTEALQMRASAWPRGWRTIAVVTSPLHSRRACATFEAVGFTVVCAPAASREHLVPEALSPRDRLATFRAWIYEKFATATYRSNGWIR